MSLPQEMECGKKKAQVEKEEPIFESVGQIWRSVLVLSIAITFVFTAYSPLQDLQSSLFVDDGMGSTVLAIRYGSSLIALFFLPTSMINTLGSKWTLVISMFFYIIFTAAHFYASWELFIPSALILGIGAAPLWIAKSHYLNIVAHDYAKKKGITEDAAANLFFGVAFLFYQSASIWGNIISSQVLSPSGGDFSIATVYEEELLHCGKSFCPQIAHTNNTNLNRPSANKLNMLAGIYTGFAAFAVLIVIFLLQQLPSEKNMKIGGFSRDNCRPKLLVSTFVHMADYRQLLLIPLTIYSGLEQAFFASDYTQAFVTCPLGNWWVGYVVISYGVIASLTSVLFGKLVEFVGRVPFIVLGAASSAAVIVTLLNYDVTQDKLYVYFIFAGVLGMTDSIWQTQISALYGVLFKDNSEAAFSNQRVWKNVGFIIAFAYQSHLCLPTKAYILLAVLGLSMVGYGSVEYLDWKKHRKGSDNDFNEKPSTIVIKASKADN